MDGHTRLLTSIQTLQPQKKAYHTELADKIGVASYDNVTVTLTDSNGTVIMCEHDEKFVQIAPEVQG